MKCDNVLKFFEAINQIPRGSGNEKGVTITLFPLQRKEICGFIRIVPIML